MKSKYDIIATRLKEDIEKGVYSEKMPSERDLAEIFNSTTVTVRRAQDILIEAGLLRKVQPLGTFVVPQFRPKITVSLSVSEFFLPAVKEIKKSMIKCFPEVDIDIQHAVYAPEKLVEFDLVRVAGVSPMRYNDFARPFSESLIKKFENEQYYQKAFEVHRDGDFYYGVPLFVSPVLLIANRSLLKDPGSVPAPYKLDLEVLSEMAKMAKKKKIFLWSTITVYYLLRSIVFCSTDESNLIRNVDIEKLRSLMTRFWPLFSPELISPDNESFHENDTILNFACRQGMYAHDLEKTALLGWPVELSEKINLAGEFLFLNNRCASPETAGKVAAHFLSPEVQNIIGKYRLGIPVLKSAAFDSIDSRLYRDDLFFNEIKNVYINDNSVYDFSHRLHCFLRDILSGDMDFDKFIDHLEHEIAMAKKQEETIQYFTQGDIS